MSVIDQLIAGLELTIAGMATVFILLTFMVLVIHWMSKLAHRLAPPQPHQSMHPHSEPGALDPSLVSAISAAVHRYRNDKN